MHFKMILKVIEYLIFELKKKTPENGNLNHLLNGNLNHLLVTNEACVCIHDSRQQKAVR